MAESREDQRRRLATERMRRWRAANPERARDPQSPSLDHRIPLARGGAHSYANIQAAHLDCNRAKGATIPEAA